MATIIGASRRGGTQPPNHELTLVGGVDNTDIVSGSGSRANLSDKDLVESVLRELSEAADKWEALVAQAETVTYSVDLGDIQAVANSAGRLLQLTLHPGATGYAPSTGPPRHLCPAGRRRHRRPPCLIRKVRT